MDVYRSIVMTGGGGMLAHALAEQLRHRGVGVVALSRADCDITRPDAVEAMFQTYRPTLLLNCAAHTGVDQCEDEPHRCNAINGEALGTLGTQARRYDTRIVHFSTDFVFDGQSDRPYRPIDPPSPVSAYGASKLLGENILAQTSPPSWLIIRTAWLFGRHGACFPQTILKLARSGRQLKVVNDQLGCPTYTIDLARATLNLIDVNALGIQHVTNSSPTTWCDFANAILQEFGFAPSVIPVSTEEWLRMRPKQARRPAYSVLDMSSYTAITGQTVRDWREALRDYRAECSTEAEISPLAS